ncbi:MAG: hypothetical protein IE909_18555, partial [Campylobacterales bacterium]|nr:hypothetical protein [Campylobacterales bacterium]
VESSTKEYLFFFDVDLAFSENFFALLLDKLDKELIKNNKKFLMLPCLYLSKKGTAFFEHAESNQIALDHLRESFLLGENNLVERLAVNTSAILLKKEYFIEIGKFSENFFGHGGEDFELLHRLVANSPYALQNKDKYYIDKVEQFPANYTGFRQYMAYYSLPYLFSDLLIVHKWHERPLFNSFYMTRVNNENLLVKKMKEYDRHFSEIIWLSKQEPEEYSQFLKSLMLVNGFEDEKYVGLFKYKDGVKIRKRPISAKIRKLLTRPGMFFQDIKFIQLIKNWK